MREGLEVFTVEEVNRRLPLIQRIVGDVRAIALEREGKEKAYRRFRECLKHSNSRELEETVERLRRELAELYESLESLKREIMELGGYLKDIRQGYVDFFSRRGDRPVFLCWRLGEPEVLYWHSIEKAHDIGGVEDRRRLYPGLEREHVL